jgi:hypothetical protein
VSNIIKEHGELGHLRQKVIESQYKITNCSLVKVSGFFPLLPPWLLVDPVSKVKVSVIDFELSGIVNTSGA